MHRALLYWAYYLKLWVLLICFHVHEYAAGLDLAYISNGYVYHTVFDKPEMIPAGSIQQAGEHFDSFILIHSDALDVSLLWELELELET